MIFYREKTLSYLLWLHFLRCRNYLSKHSGKVGQGRNNNNNNKRNRPQKSWIPCRSWVKAQDTGCKPLPRSPFQRKGVSSGSDVKGCKVWAAKSHSYRLPCWPQRNRELDLALQATLPFPQGMVSSLSGAFGCIRSLSLFFPLHILCSEGWAWGGRLCIAIMQSMFAKRSESFLPIGLIAKRCLSPRTALK